MTLTVAVAQFAPGEDKAANLQTIDALVTTAAQRGARLVVLPEFAVYSARHLDHRFVENAEPLDGPTVRALATLSAKRQVTIVVGVNETADEGRIHNTLVALRDGELAAVYRKVHLYDAFGVRESDRVVPGEPQAVVLDVDGYAVGLQTCYDLRFPESSRALVDAGAEILAIPAEWYPGPLKEYHWTTLLRARAIENTAYVLAANHVGRTGVGHSMVLDPAGTAVSALGEAAGVAVADVDRDRLDQVRETNPALAVRKYRVLPR